MSKNNNKSITHVLLVTDASGSMGRLADDVRGGYNGYLDELAADTAAKYRITSALFDTGYKRLCVAAKLADADRLDVTNYRPGGGTSLLDAIGQTIADFETRVPELADGDRVLLVVSTDGCENSSVEYSKDAVRTLIKEREKTGNWSCVFLGAGPDAWLQAGGLGFAAGSTVHTAASSVGTQSSYTGLTRGTEAFAAGADGAAVAEIVATTPGVAADDA